MKTAFPEYWAARGGSPGSAACADAAADPQLHPIRRLQNGWVCFLSRWTWDWFCTFTFDPKKHSSPNGLIHPEKATKAFRLFVHELNTRLYGKNWKRRDESVHFALAVEFHKSGVIHMHALIGAERDLNEVARRMEMKEWWYENFGIARIEKPDDAGDVQAYCSKYVVKGGEIVLSDNLRSTVRQMGLDLAGVKLNN